MLKYQIHKLSKGEKEARAVLLEDILTSDVFGVMDYFPYDVLLRPFLEQVALKNPKSGFSAPDVEPICVHFWKAINWPTNLPNLDRDSIEPDVLIEWPEILLMIEAKFISPADPEELLREFLVGATEASSGQRFFLILIDKNLSPSGVAYGGDKITISEYVRMRLQDLNLSEKFPPEQVCASLLWINWQSFYALVERLVKNDRLTQIVSANRVSIRILRDLLLILERKGLIPFEVLVLEDFERYALDLNSLGQLGLMMQRAFSDLSDTSIDVEALATIGLELKDPVPILAGFQLYEDVLTSVLS